MADDVAIHVEGMDCGQCVLTITEALSAVAGVTAVQIESATGRTVVAGQDLDETAIRSAVARAGYIAHDPKPSPEVDP